MVMYIPAAGTGAASLRISAPTTILCPETYAVARPDVGHDLIALGPAHQPLSTALPRPVPPQQGRMHAGRQQPPARTAS